MKTKAKERPTRAASVRDGAGVDDSRRIEQERLSVKQAYAQLFSGEVGSRVLEDLLRRYGWRDGVELASYRVGLGHADMCFIEGQKEVVRYVLTQVQALTREG